MPSQSCHSSQKYSDASANYTYMQIFYFGRKTYPGSAFISFTPEFQKQKDIKLNEQVNDLSNLGFNEIIKVQEERDQKMRGMLIKTLNTVTVEGWEIVQMSSYGDGGLVYLLRRVK